MALVLHARNLRGATVQLSQALEESALTWVQICRAGNYLGYSAGPVEWTAETFQKVVENIHRHPSFRVGPDGVGIAPVVAYDYEHASELDPTSGTVPLTGTPACGWVFDLQVRAGADGVAELWALSEFLPHAREQIRSGAYRWTSVAVWTDAVDPVTGEELGPVLTSVALTNHPFVQGMTPLAASARGAIGSAAEGSRTSTRMPDPAEKKLNRRLAKALVKQRRIKHEDVPEEEIAEEAAEAMDALQAIADLIGSPDADKLVEKAAKMAADAAKLSEVLPALEQARAALRAGAEKEADEEAQFVAEDGSDDKVVQQRLFQAAKVVRRGCIKDDGTVDDAKLKEFRATWGVDEAKLREQRKTLLTSKIVASAEGGQIGSHATGAPKPGALPPDAPAGGGVRTPDGKLVSELLDGVEGFNEIEKARRYLCATNTAIKSAPHPRQCWLASEFLRTGKAFVG